MSVSTSQKCLQATKSASYSSKFQQSVLPIHHRPWQQQARHIQGLQHIRDEGIIAANPERPRWKAPPPQMTAPVRSKPPIYHNEFKVNANPRKLNDFYATLFGPGKEETLTEEVKWLVVTHKSFDHGRRGFNDRLAYLGKRIVELQTSLSLLHSRGFSSTPSTPDPFKRDHTPHPALEGLESLNEYTKNSILSKEKIGQLAEKYGIAEVMRWKPKRVSYSPSLIR